MIAPALLVHDADDRRRAGFGVALRDFLRGVRLTELWLTMGWYDMRQRYSRSVLGPLWVTVSLGVFVAGLGFTYAALFRVPVRDYLPYVCVGMVVWTMLSSLLGEGCTTFTAATAAIKQMPVPVSVHVMRTAWRVLIVFAHNALVIAVVLLACGLNPGATALLALPGLALLLLNGLGFSVTLGLLGARFRDVIPLVGNAVQMLLFVTPVLWRVSDLGERGAIATLNPFFHLIEIVRAPLLGQAAAPESWAAALAFTAANLAIAALFYTRLHWRVAYWL